MAKGDAPTPPNPTATINAQSAANSQSAQQTAELNRINQNTPYGSSSYEVTGTYPDGTPIYTQNTTLSPTNQQLFDLQNNGALSLGQTATGMLGQVQNAYANPINTSSQPGLASNVNAGTPSYYNGGTPNYQSGIRSQGQITGNAYNTGPGLQGAVDSQSGNVQTGINNQGPSLQSSLNNTGPGLQGSLDTSGIPGLASNANYNGIGITGQIAGQGDTSGAIQSARDAAYRSQTQYLDPQYDQGQKQLENSLINQGVTQGSEAYNNAVMNFSRQKQAAYQGARDSATAAGDNEQNTLFGQGLSSAQLQNSAQAQGFGQAFSNAQLQNSANAQGYTNALNAGNFQNAAHGQGFNEALQSGNFNNAANAQGFNQGLQSGNFNNAAVGQQFNQNLQAGNFQNQANQQGYNQGLSNANLQNAAQAQSFGQGLQRTNLANSTAAQQLQDRLQANQQNNTAQGQQFNQGLQNANLQNSTQNQYLQQLFALRNQPLNEYNALASGSQVTNPTFGAVPNANVATTDVGGITNSAYQNQLSSYNAQQQGINNLFSLGGSLGSAIMASDRRLKRDIRLMGVGIHGLNIYEFRYTKDGEAGERYLGVMADEVLPVMPEAVLIDENGYMAVDYGRLVK